MATIAHFDEANDTLRGGPAEKYGTPDDVLDLPIWRGESQDDTPWVISCWELSEEELTEVARTGKVWICVVGHTHPPLSIAGRSPFEHVDEGQLDVDEAIAPTSPESVG